MRGSWEFCCPSTPIKFCTRCRDSSSRSSRKCSSISHYACISMYWVWSDESSLGWWRLWLDLSRISFLIETQIGYPTCTTQLQMMIFPLPLSSQLLWFLILHTPKHLLYRLHSLQLNSRRYVHLETETLSQFPKQPLTEKSLREMYALNEGGTNTILKAGYIFKRNKTGLCCRTCFFFDSPS